MNRPRAIASACVVLSLLSAGCATLRRHNNKGYFAKDDRNDDFSKTEAAKNQYQDFQYLLSDYPRSSAYQYSLDQSPQY
ncbi:MAG: hypothetical protein P4L84_02820 [Isosphaeraceae bacterium]|nr:hypothetical protein [Isosphaeraceae bacterium]